MKYIFQKPNQRMDVAVIINLESDHRILRAKVRKTAKGKESI